MEVNTNVLVVCWLVMTVLNLYLIYENRKLRDKITYLETKYEEEQRRFWKK